MGRIRDINRPSQIPSKPDLTDYDEEHPIFSFEFIKNGYDVRDCSKEDKAQLAMTLSNLSKLTWAEIKNQNRHKRGSEKLTELSHKLPSKFQGKTPIVFRFSDMKPMIGVRVEQVFYIIWLDPKMKLYKH